jgi:hypothetical protein
MLRFVSNASTENTFFVGEECNVTFDNFAFFPIKEATEDAADSVLFSCQRRYHKS